MSKKVVLLKVGSAELPAAANVDYDAGFMILRMELHIDPLMKFVEVYYTLRDGGFAGSSWELRPA